MKKLLASGDDDPPRSNGRGGVAWAAPELGAAMGLAPYRPAFFARRRLRSTSPGAWRTWASSLCRRLSLASEGRGTSSSRGPACWARVTASPRAVAHSQMNPADRPQLLGGLGHEPPATPMADRPANRLDIAARPGSFRKRGHRPQDSSRGPETLSSGRDTIRSAREDGPCPTTNSSATLPHMSECPTHVHLGFRALVSSTSTTVTDAAHSPPVQTPRCIDSSHALT
jgi:hypothetical protein